MTQKPVLPVEVEWAVSLGNSTGGLFLSALGKYCELIGWGLHIRNQSLSYDSFSSFKK
jgi:hypothetical protein